MAISACVVDLPGREPNWLSSNTGSRVGINQSLTMPSRILAVVGNSEMGRRSFDIEADFRNWDYFCGFPYRGKISLSDRGVKDSCYSG